MADDRWQSVALPVLDLIAGKEVTEYRASLSSPRSPKTAGSTRTCGMSSY
jgi:hypothetical protein